MMLDYGTLRVIWWLVLGTVLIGFAVLDGFDLGVGVLFRFLGRDDDERRALLHSIEPVWEGNQVWLVLGAGAVFAAWPLLYAAAFSCLYLVMFVLLAALLLRPVGFNFRDKLAEPSWRGVWDAALCIGGAVPALLCGVIIGNLFLGVPFHFDPMRRAVSTGSFVGLLRPFALLVGLVGLSMLVAHGGHYAALNVGEPMATRARGAARAALVVFAATFILAGLWLARGIAGQHVASLVVTSAPSDPLTKHVVVAPGLWLQNYRDYPVLWLVPALALSFAATAFVCAGARRDVLAWVASSGMVKTVILTAAIALFPFVLPSGTHPDHGLTVWDASSSQATLQTLLVAVLILLPIVLAYTAWVYRVMRGRVRLEQVRDHHGGY